MAHHFEKVSVFTRQIHIHYWVYTLIIRWQRTWKLMIEILMLIPLLTYFSYRYNNAKINESIKYVWKPAHSSLIKIIFDGDNNFMQNICNKWMRYRNVLPNHKKWQFLIIYNSSTWSSTNIKTHKYWPICSWNICVHLHGWDVRDANTNYVRDANTNSIIKYVCLSTKLIISYDMCN